MPFPRNRAEELLAQCHRRCCICHRFCGVKIELDHIIPRSEDGPDDIENAIPVCFECHAEIHSYNVDHPRGRRFRSDELKYHKEQWLKVCRENPGALLNAPRESVVGPLQALIDELEYNQVLFDTHDRGHLGCTFMNDQFGRALNEGAIAVLQDDLKNSILTAYATLREINELISGASGHCIGSNPYAMAVNRKDELRRDVNDKIATAKEALLEFLSSESS